MHIGRRAHGGPLRRRRRTAAIAAAVTLLPLLAMMPAQPTAEAASQSALAKPAVSGSPVTITLITGDRVRFTPAANGPPTFAVDPAPRPDNQPVAFHSEQSGSDFYVIPSDALPYVGAGTLEKALFNLPGLVREEYDDAHAKQLPVIVTFSGKPSAAAVRTSADALAGAKRTVTLGAIRGAALQLDRKRGAARFWQGLVPSPAKAQKLSGGVDKIWLDHKVTVALNESVPQIGAPEAWKAGYDGKGVKVAVVDSGIDGTHPDLTGKIAEEKNFTDEPDATDGHGHGTHVASTIAGSGAASEGKYKGVAPGATLLNGKVVNKHGKGSSSSLMAGMDWAAHNGAKVINISLGLEQALTDGTDLVCQTLNNLTAETGALFVVAAGNDGRTSIRTPGAAEAALTVGAVDKQDKLASFSSRGPRLDNGGAKPEITAPGMGIVAARAAGTSQGEPVNDRYARLSGTSMATPHTAGAAAIFVQAYPDRKGPEIKDALVTSAKDGGYRWFEQGAGRVDVPRSLQQKVLGPASVNFGRLTRGGEAVLRRLTYRNSTDAAVTLNLALTAQSYGGKPVPDGAVRLGAATLDVPAHGEAGVDLTADPKIGDGDAYGGLVMAKTADGAVGSRTVFGYYLPPPMGRVTVRLTDFRGQPAKADVKLLSHTFDPDDPRDPFDKGTYLVKVQDGVGSVEVPHGVYDVMTSRAEYNMAVRRADITTAVEVPVTGNTEVALDERKNVQTNAVPPHPADTYDHAVRYGRTFGKRSSDGVTWTGRIQRYGTVFATPTRKATRGTLDFNDFWMLADKLLDVRVRTPQPFALNPLYDVDVVGTMLAGRRSLPLVWAGEGRPEDFEKIDARGKLALVRVPNPSGAVASALNSANVATGQAAAASAAGVVVYTDQSGSLAIPPATFNTPAAPQLFVTNAEGEKLRGLTAQGAVTIDLNGNAAPAAMYNQIFHDEQAVPAGLERRIDPARMLAVPTRYHADRPGLRYGKIFGVSAPRGWGIDQGVSQQRFAAPATWTEYYGPVDDRFVWQRKMSLSGDEASAELSDVFLARRRAEDRWFGAPVRYGAAEVQAGSVECSFCRADNDQFVPGLQQIDATGHFAKLDLSDESMEAAGTKIKLFRDGTEIAPNHDVSWSYPTFKLAPDPATYRLETDVPPPTYPPATEAPEAVFRTVPHVLTTWTFKSQRPTAALPAGYTCSAGPTAAKCSFQPLIEPRYRPDVDLNNQAMAGRAHSFRVHAGPHSGAVDAGRVDALKLDYSTDEGKTWQRAQVTSLGGGAFQVVVQHPKLADTKGFVWLRTEARDSAGNQVVQTIQRAYALAREQ